MSKKFRRHFHKPTKTDTYTPPYSDEVLNKSVDDIGLQVATLELIKSANILTVGDIAKRREREMFKIQRFGRKQLDDVKKALNALAVDFRPNEAKTEQKPETKSNEGTHHKQEKQKKSSAPGEPEEWVKFTRNGKWGFKDLQNREVIPPRYDEIFLFHEGLACFEIRGEFGYINTKGEVVIEPKYECAMSFSEGLASVTLDGKCGYIDKSGNVVIDYAYDAATAFSDGFARIKLDGKWGTITPVGEINWTNKIG